MTNDKFTRRQIATGSLAALAMASASPVLAQDKPVTWRAVANQRTGGQWPGKWQWLQKELPGRTGNKLAIDLTTLPELGLSGFELVRVLGANLVDIADVVTGYVSGDVPLIEGAQLPGIYTDYEHARKGYAEWLPKVVQAREKNMGGRAISSFAFANLYLWTKTPINSLADIKGKKIRIFAKAQADYVTALGAEGVSIPVAEVYTALERGTVDGTITGPDAVEGMKLHEVIKYVTDLQLGVGAGFIVVSRKSWDALPANLRDTLANMGPELTKRGWDIGLQDSQKGLDFAKSKGVQATIPPKDDWRPALKNAAREVVNGWAKRVGPEGAKVFNETLGSTVGFTI
jgi:TRAP-type C4-dicarboxylate transport system substrate-binding protein